MNHFNLNQFRIITALTLFLCASNSTVFCSAEDSISIDNDSPPPIYVCNSETLSEMSIDIDCLSQDENSTTLVIPKAKQEIANTSNNNTTTNAVTTALSIGSSSTVQSNLSPHRTSQSNWRKVIRQVIAKKREEQGVIEASGSLVIATSGANDRVIKSRPKMHNFFSNVMEKMKQKELKGVKEPIAVHPTLKTPPGDGDSPGRSRFTTSKSKFARNSPVSPVGGSPKAQPTRNSLVANKHTPVPQTDYSSSTPRKLQQTKNLEEIQEIELAAPPFLTSVATRTSLGSTKTKHSPVTEETPDDNKEDEDNQTPKSKNSTTGNSPFDLDTPSIDSSENIGGDAGTDNHDYETSFITATRDVLADILDEDLKKLSDNFPNFLEHNKRFIEVIRTYYSQKDELTTETDDFLNFNGKARAEQASNILHATVSTLNNIAKVILPFTLNTVWSVPSIALSACEFGTSFLKGRVHSSITHKLKTCQKFTGDSDKENKNFMFNVLHDEILNTATTDLLKIYNSLKEYTKNKGTTYTGVLDRLEELTKNMDVLKANTGTNALLKTILTGAKFLTGITASVFDMIPKLHDYQIINIGSLSLTPSSIAILTASSLALIYEHIESANKEARQAKWAVKICETYTSLLDFFQYLCDIYQDDDNEETEESALFSYEVQSDLS